MTGLSWVIGAGIIAVASYSIQSASAAIDVRIADCRDSANTHGLLGQHIVTYVQVNADEPIGRAHIRVRYSFPGLTFLGANPTGQMAEWEHFNWTHSADSTFSDSGYAAVDFVAIADLDNGDEIHPPQSALQLSSRSIRLHFWLTGDRNLGNQCPKVLLDSDVCGGVLFQNPTDDVAYIPTGSPAGCPEFAGLELFDIVGTSDGAVCIDLLGDDRGDINLNGQERDVGDAVLLGRFLAFGEDVFDPVWKDVQILATDINDDGIVGTVADLVFLIREIASGGRPAYGTGIGDCW